jgi:hypothetical protein
MDRLEDFLAPVRCRLEKGREAYGDRTFELPASNIIIEAQDELLDNAAYSFIAWCRLERHEVDRASTLRRPLGGFGQELEEEATAPQGGASGFSYGHRGAEKISSARKGGSGSIGRKASKRSATARRSARASRGSRARDRREGAKRGNGRRESRDHREASPHDRRGRKERA